MVDCVVFVMETKVVDFSAANPNFYGSKRILEAFCTIRLAIQVENHDISVLCQVKYIIYVGFYSFLRSVVVILGIFRFFLYNSH